MNKIFLSIACFFISLLSFSQNGKVGINTDKPTSTLDVNGDIRISEELRLGGDDNTDGSFGKIGHAIISNGEGLNPEWNEIDSTPDQGDYFLKNSIIKTDTKGLYFTNTQRTTPVTYTENSIISSSNLNSGSWQLFQDLVIDIPPMTNDFRIVINIQAVATSEYIGLDGGNGKNSFAVAVAMVDNSGNKRIKAVRTATARGKNNPQLLFNMQSILEDLPTNQKIRLEILGSHRNTSHNKGAGNYKEYPGLAIGRDIPSKIGTSADQSFSKRATVRIDIFEKIIK